MTAMNVRETPEHVLHREECERRIEALEEIIRVQANSIAMYQRAVRESTVELTDHLNRFHGGARA